MTPLRIALLQGPSGTPVDNAAGAARLGDAIARAAEAGARLLVTPELSLTGYALGDSVQGRAEAADGPGAARVARAAAEHGIAVVHGFPERDPATGAVHNSVQLTGADGRVAATYRKTHLYGEFERGAFTPGEDLVVQAELGGLTVGLLVCYDVEFPEAVRAHALAGTDLLLVPTALMRPYAFVARTLVPTRAWENQLWIAYANRCGTEGDLRFTGLSALAAPDGTAPVRAGEGAELLLGTVDPELLAASRAENPYLADRRPALYADRASRGG
ncbi:carbon-nitrogen hydrolase family protein [Streptomyces bohaiensis]|uniref:Carbon-nitrogen hydrolase family protein n=1 Tax=Streptomyces bohaiensis TaxID=1431344 RepID=A0ABX1CD41_9ACTN|nr:carbon-nitrogen hydrolase family protein [Streptomyces bohaiensis]NJQ17018.1 carbon-nitrogen hydrolase family protein [Streptomyces bohaiensis]